MTSKRVNLLVPLSVLASLMIFGASCALPQAPSISKQPEPLTTASHDDIIADDKGFLTEKDFSGGSGLSARKSDGTEDTFRVSIHPNVPMYTFHVISSSSTANIAGSIEVFRGTDLHKPLQVIRLDSNMRLSDMAPAFFNVQDINFDGFADIGVPIEGGAKWSSYLYWTFDQQSGTFVSSTVAEDLRKIQFNFISFDSSQKQITTDNLEGAGWRTLYQFQDGHIFPVKEEQLDSIIQSDQNASTGHPTLHCSITTTTYLQGKPRVITKEVPQDCSRSMHTIPFTYPEAYRERFQ